MIAFLHGFGIRAMNIRVNTYADEASLQAAKPVENTLGILCGAMGWRIVDKLPDVFDTGVAYILVGSSGKYELATGDIRLHPVEVWQDGNAQDGWIYRDAAWVKFAQSWDGYYFRDGNQYEGITGGWKKVSEGGTVTIGDELTVKSPYSGVAAEIRTEDAVDLTNVSTLYFDSPSGRNGNAYGAYIHISTATTTVRQVQFTDAGQGSIDVSDLTGKYFLSLRTVGGGNGSGYGDIRAIWRD